MTKQDLNHHLALRQRLEEAAAWTGNIDDMQTRIIFRLRYICGFTRKEVAALTGGGNTDRSARIRAYRYMKARVEG